MSRPVLNEAERRWLHALLVVATITVSLILVGLIANILVFFQDILLVFMLAWLLAFVISPVVSAVLRAFPTLPRALVVVLIYIGLLFAITAVVLVAASSLATSIASFVTNLPDLQTRLPQILAPWQEQVNALGLHVNLVTTAQDALQRVGNLGGDLIRPLTDLALASLVVFGNLMLIIFLSLFVVIDKDRIVAFVNRLVPPRYSDEARLFESSVATSFGGFLRGQALQGVIFAGFAVFAHLAFGLDYAVASAALVGVLQMIPFFGPFFSWAPPIVVAALTHPAALLPTIIVMVIGWFIVMNIVQPRVMATAVGIHPVVVLGSVLVGLRLAGIPGAIFGMPVAAVFSSFFFHYLNRSAGPGSRDVASRAARRLGQREGRHVRVPIAPPLPPAAPTTPTSASAAQTAAAPGRRVMATPADPRGAAASPDGTNGRDGDHPRGEPADPIVTSAPADDEEPEAEASVPGGRVE